MGTTDTLPHTQPGADNPLREESVGDLMKQLAQDTSTLVRKEIELAKAETAEKGRKAGPGLGMFGGAGLLGMLAAGTFTLFLIALIDLVTPTWAAALIVTVVYLAIAGALALVGKGKVKEALPPAPEQTIETVKEDVAWAKTQMRSAGK